MADSDFDTYKARACRDMDAMDVVSLMHRAATELEASSVDPIVRHLANRLRAEARRETERQTGVRQCA